MPEETEENRDIVDDLDALGEATEQLEENGTDANVEVLREAAGVFDEPIEIGEDELDGGELADEEGAQDTVDFLKDGRAALLTIADGEGDEDDVETAAKATTIVHKQIGVIALQSALGL